MNDQALLQATAAIARKEKEILSLVLIHLNEVGRRRLCADLMYKSLFDFAVRHLGYAEDAAYRRIAASTLLREIPAIKAFGSKKMFAYF